VRLGYSESEQETAKLTDIEGGREEERERGKGGGEREKFIDNQTDD
jgi:hypothetical protein